MSRYIPDHARGKILSIKFVLNLSVGAAVIPISSLLLKAGYELSTLFSFMSALAIFVVLASIILPSREHKKLRK